MNKREVSGPGGPSTFTIVLELAPFHPPSHSRVARSTRRGEKTPLVGMSTAAETGQLSNRGGGQTSSRNAGHVSSRGGQVSNRGTKTKKSATSAQAAATPKQPAAKPLSELTDEELVASLPKDALISLVLSQLRSNSLLRSQVETSAAAAAAASDAKKIAGSLPPKGTKKGTKKRATPPTKAANGEAAASIPEGEEGEEEDGEGEQVESNGGSMYIPAPEEALEAVTDATVTGESEATPVEEAPTAKAEEKRPNATEATEAAAVPTTVPNGQAQAVSASAEQQQPPSPPHLPLSTPEKMLLDDRRHGALILQKVQRGKSARKLITERRSGGFVSAEVAIAAAEAAVAAAVAGGDIESLKDAAAAEILEVAISFKQLKDAQAAGQGVMAAGPAGTSVLEAVGEETAAALMAPAAQASAPAAAVEALQPVQEALQPAVAEDKAEGAEPLERAARASSEPKTLLDLMIEQQSSRQSVLDAAETMSNKVSFSDHTGKRRLSREEAATTLQGAARRRRMSARKLVADMRYGGAPVPTELAVEKRIVGRVAAITAAEVAEAVGGAGDDNTLESSKDTAAKEILEVAISFKQLKDAEAAAKGDEVAAVGATDASAVKSVLEAVDERVAMVASAPAATLAAPSASAAPSAAESSVAGLPETAKDGGREGGAGG